MFAAIKTLLLVIYLLALARLVGQLPGSFGIVVVVAGALLVAHFLELLFMFKHVRRYRGALATSVALTLLFGILHWKPLADRLAREKT